MSMGCIGGMLFTKMYVFDEVVWDTHINNFFDGCTKLGIPEARQEIPCMHYLSKHCKGPLKKWGRLHDFIMQAREQENAVQNFIWDEIVKVGFFKWAVRYPEKAMALPLLMKYFMWEDILKWEQDTRLLDPKWQNPDMLRGCEQCTNQPCYCKTIIHPAHGKKAKYKTVLQPQPGALPCYLTWHNDPDYRKFLEGYPPTLKAFRL